MGNPKDITKIRNGFRSVASALTYRMQALLKLKTIPAIVQKTELISAMIDGEYLLARFSLERAEFVRKELRDLMAYLPNEKNYVIINVGDWVEDKEPESAPGDKPYPQKAQEYLNGSTLPALAKLRNLDPLTDEEKKELESTLPYNHPNFDTKLGWFFLHDWTNGASEYGAV